MSSAATAAPSTRPRPAVATTAKDRTMVSAPSPGTADAVGIDNALDQEIAVVSVFVQRLDAKAGVGDGALPMGRVVEDILRLVLNRWSSKVFHPFDQAARRHTSFASVYVWPELPEDVDVEIDENDLRVDLAITRTRR